MKFQELDLVRLLCDVPSERTTDLSGSHVDLAAGEMGTVLLVFDNPSEAYEVEFGVERNESILCTLQPNEIELVQRPLRDAEQSRKAVPSPHASGGAFWLSFHGLDVSELLALAEHLQQRGFRPFIFNQSDVIVSVPNPEGEDYKQITVLDETSKTAGDCLDRAELSEERAAHYREKFQEIATVIGVSDWRDLTPIQNMDYFLMTRRQNVA